MITIIKNLFRKKIIPPIKDPERNLINNIFFIHVPKTGGTSIAKTLGLDRYTHIKAYEIVAAGKECLLKDNFSFGVVRNPFDRFVSLYNYSRMDISHYHNNIVEPENKSSPRHLDYELLRNSSIEECAIFLKKNLLKHDLEWNQWVPQYTWLFDKKNKKPLVEKVFKMENLSELKSDLNKFGYDIESFPHYNKSKESNYRRIINSETRNILEEIYKKDLEFFGYSF